MTELSLPQRVANIAGVVFLNEEKMINWEFGGAA